MTKTIGSDAPTWAEFYEANGLLPIPVLPNLKRSSLYEWNDRQSHRDQVTPNHNLGVVLGTQYADVDLDSDLAVIAASYVLPDGAAWFGRAGRATHAFYPLTESTVPLKMKHAELRTGFDHYTLVPPSTHPTGDVLRWDAQGDRPDLGALPEIEPLALEYAVRTLNGLCHLAECAEKGTYHTVSLSLAGLCFHRGVTNEAAVAVILALLQHQGSNGQGKTGNVNRTYRRGAAGGTVAIWEPLRELGYEKQVGLAKSNAPAYRSTRDSAQDDFAHSHVDEIPEASGVNPFLAYAVAAGDLVAEPPPRVWTWDQWIPRDVVTGLAGPPGVAKSTLALQLCVHKVLGLPFLNSPMKKGRAVFITVEDDLNELHRRLHNLCDSLFIDVKSLGNDLLLLPLAEEDTLLVKGSDHGPKPTKLYAAMEEMVTGYDLAVLDLINDFWDGSDNQRAEISPYIRKHLGGIARRQQLAWVAISHPSIAAIKEGRGFAGSTSVVGSYRSAITMEPREDGAIDLKRVKANYAPRAEKVIQWRGGYLWPIEEMEIVAATQKLAQASQSVVLDALEDSLRPDGWATSRTVWETLGSERVSDGGGAGLYQKAVTRDLEALVKSGQAVKKRELTENRKSMRQIYKPVEDWSESESTV